MAAGKKKRIALILFLNTLAVLLLIAGAELALRAGRDPEAAQKGTVILEPYYVPDAEDPDYWVTNPKLAGPRFNPEQRTLSDNQLVMWNRFSRTIPEGVYRIFVFGSSPIYGSSLPSWYNLSTHLASLLYRRRPDLAFEIIDASRQDMSAEDLENVSRRIATFDSDMVIMYPGGAIPTLEFSGPLEDTLEANAPFFLRWAAKSEILRLARGLKSGPPSPPADEMRLVNSPDRQDSALAGKIRRIQAMEAKNYGEFLDRTVKVLKDRNRRLLLMTTASNLADFPPIWSIHFETLGKKDINNFSRLFDAGRRLLEEGRIDEAGTKLEEALSISDTYAHLHYLLGKVHQGAGRFVQAGRAFRKARDLDVSHERLFNEPLALIRAAGEKYGVEVVESEELLAVHSPGGLVGSSLFRDHTHMTPFGLAILAEDLVDRVFASKDWPEPGEPLAPPKLPFFSMHDPRTGITLHGRSPKLQSSDVKQMRATGPPPASTPPEDIHPDL